MPRKCGAWVGLVGLFHPYTCARTHARQKGPEKAHHANQAHPVQEIRRFQQVGLPGGLRNGGPLERYSNRRN